MDRQPGFSIRAGWAAGQPISALMSQALAHPELISLAAGFVDQMTMPGELVKTAVARLLATPEAARTALQYGTTPGVPGLRDLILQRLLTQDGGTSGIDAPSIDQLVVTAGSNQLIHLVLESLLDPGDIVFCAAPTYLVFLGIVNQLGARAIGVPTDAEGMIPSALQEAFEQLDQQGEKDRVKAIYLVPYADNPSGITMPLERSAEIMQISRQWSSDQLPIQLIADLAFEGHADEPAALTDHEVDRLRRDMLCEHRQVAFILSTWIINQDDHLPRLEVF